MRFDRALLALILLLAVSRFALAAESHGLLTEILRDYVHDGLVDYKTLRADRRLDRYIQQLAHTDPDRIDSEKARLAFYLNAYNAYTLKIICENYPVKSINDLHRGGLILGKVLKRTMWDRPFVTINNHKTTLNAIEHQIIRPVFKDPRVHFALVCAAKSCPPLRSEAYEGDKLDEQLNEQARKFLADRSKNSFDNKNKVASISKIFTWFAQDFGGTDEKVLAFIANFLPEENAELSSWRIRYVEYDWSLNEQ